MGCEQLREYAIVTDEKTTIFSSSCLSLFITTSSIILLRLHLCKYSSFSDTHLTITHLDHTTNLPLLSK